MYEQASKAITHLSAALDEYEKARDKMAALTEYYDTYWKKDFIADEAGLLPPDLKRGILSEDGLWNLLEDYRELKGRIKDLSIKEE